MNDSPERAIGEAEEWMQSAEDKLPRAKADYRAASVCCAAAIHAIIRANDAITLKFDQKKVTRHDDASGLFSKLVKQNKLLEEDGRFIVLLQKSAMHKSGADYGKENFGHEDAKYFVSEGKEFIAAMKKRLE
ncbi:MAG: HEPN domain-containing protein [Candidatus Micrarchaeota archaeon]